MDSINQPLSDNKTSTSLSNSSDETIDPRNLIISNSDAFSQEFSSSLIPSDIDQSQISSLSSHVSAMASNTTSTNSAENSSSFGINAYNSVTKLETGTFNDWKL